MSSTPSPIFIVGTSRSGSTLLSRIINNHPEIAIFPETWIFSHIALMNFKEGQNLKYQYLGKKLQQNLKKLYG